MVARNLPLEPEQSTIGELDAVHQDAATRAITNVLGTEVALTTYAQIIDGLPLCDIAWDTRGSRLVPQHPINLHTQLCPGTSSKAESFRADLSITQLSFDTQVLAAFQRALPSSRSFDLRLLELVSIAVHYIGVLLHQHKLYMHDPSTTDNLDVEAVTAWEEPPDDWPRLELDPTLFIHKHFAAHTKYPNGIDDIVGYWAENRILGGVLLFDRSKTWDDETNPEPNAYIEAGRDKVTFRICQLLDTQQKQLLSFLTADRSRSEAQNPDGPLPMLPTTENRVRIETRDAIPVHKIYRDIWERAGPPENLSRLQQYPRRVHMDYLDYPELGTTEDVMRELDEASRRSPIP